MATRTAKEQTERTLNRLEAIVAELANMQGIPVEAGGRAKPSRRLIDSAITRLELVGSRSSLLTLPARDLENLSTRLYRGLVVADLHRSLPPRVRDRVSRSALYRFRTDLLWALDSFNRGQSIPDARLEFRHLGDRARGAERRSEVGRRKRNR